jgi:hypothetical protein
MANNPSQPTPPDPSPDTSPQQVVLKLVDADGKPRPYVVLTGYFGPAPKKDKYVRLYTGLDFASYYELLKEDILHTEQTEPQNEDSPRRAYVKAAAQVSFVQGSPGQVRVTTGPSGESVTSGEAKYLQGAVAAGQLASAIRAVTAQLPQLLLTHIGCGTSGHITCLFFKIQASHIGCCGTQTGQLCQKAGGQTQDKASALCQLTTGPICTALGVCPGKCEDK